MKNALLLIVFFLMSASCGAQVVEEGNVLSDTLNVEGGQSVQETKKAKKSKKEKKEVRTRIDDRDRAVRDILPIVGKLFPLFHETDVNGKSWSNRDIEGRVTVFYLWYQGCVPALSEMGELSAWKVMYPDVQFFSVTWHDMATTLRLTSQRNFTWTHLYNVHQMMTWVTQGVDEKNPSARDYPVTIVVDQQGFVRRAVSGTDMQTRQETLNCIMQYR